LIVLAKAVPAAIFGLAVVFFTFIGAAIPSLRQTVIFLFSRDPARFAAVCLAPETSPADTENQATPSALNLDK
jgi:hypothetical protein